MEIRGFANHAGTTPMPERRNALLAAAKLIEAVQDVVTREPGRQVGNVGRLQVFPNVRNIVPGLVKHTIEMRDRSRKNREARRRNSETRAANRARNFHRNCDQKSGAQRARRRDSRNSKCDRTSSRGTAPCDDAPAKRSSHDAQMMARLGPMGMIFIPSRGGISHSPREFSSWEACANGANVLLQTLMKIDSTAA